MRGRPPSAGGERLDLAIPAEFPLSARHGIAAVRTPAQVTTRSPFDSPDYAAARLAIHGLLKPEPHLLDDPSELHVRRDPLGKPFVEWTGATADWAHSAGLKSRHLHISNTHDGGAHIVIAAYGDELAGIGIDAVWLPRLRRPHKDRAYLLRFARKFMSDVESEAFLIQNEARYPASGVAREQGCGQSGPIEQGAHLDLAPTERRPSMDHSITSSPHHLISADHSLLLRTAAHFSLMEAASKACGTGLKIGVGMGKPTSLPKQSLGALRLTPEIELLFDAEARARLETIGAAQYEAYAHIDAEFLVSAVVLYRQRAEKDRNRGRRVAG